MSDGWWRGLTPNSPDRLFRKAPVIVASIYALVSAIWIAWSDSLLARFAGNYAHYRTFQTYKGWLFIAVTALVIYFMLRGAWHRIFRAYDESKESGRRLDLALAGARGGAWEVDLSSGREMLAYMSPELERQMGVEAGRQISVPELLSRTHPEDVEKLKGVFDDAASATSERLYQLRYRVLTRKGTYGWVHSRGTVLLGVDGKAERMIGVTLDVSKEMQAEARVEQLLRYDPLTGLPRHSKVLVDVDDTLAGANRRDLLAIVQVRLFDMDHLVGEGETVEDARVVRLIGDRLQALSDHGVVASRMATDSFAVVTPLLHSSRAVHEVVVKVMAAFAEPLDLGGVKVKLRCQAGGALFPQDGDKAHDLLRKAGLAIEKPERTAETSIHWFTEGQDLAFRIRNERLQGLAGAVANGEIEAYLQPIIDLTTGLTAGFEALARWRRQKEGLVPPAEFISLAEEFGYVSAIGEEILRQACRAAATWDQAAAPFVSVNVSQVQLDDPAFPATVARILGECGLAPARLELEITENALTGDPEAAAERLETLRALGVAIAIDDFGTGYSSLALLSRLPFTRLKIDRSFVEGYGQRHDSTTIVDVIIDLSRQLELSVTAEGVESSAQALMLTERGVELAQGFLFSSPVPLENASRFVAHKWPTHGYPENRLKVAKRVAPLR